MHQHDEGLAQGLGHNHGHGQAYKTVTVRRLCWSLAITTAAMVIELVGGLLTGSVALLSDAGHMLTHAFALGIAIAGILIHVNSNMSIELAQDFDAATLQRTIHILHGFRRLPCFP